MSTPHVAPPVQSNELVFGDYHARKKSLHTAIATMANNVLVNRMMGTRVEAPTPRERIVYVAPTASGNSFNASRNDGSLEAREAALRAQLARQQLADLREKLTGSSPF